MPLVDDLHAARDMAERSDSFAYTNGTIAAIDNDIRRLAAMSPAEQLLDEQNRVGNLSTDQQRRHLDVGMLIKVYEPTDTRYPWHTGRIVKCWPNDVTMEDRRGVLHTAPYGPRIRVVGYMTDAPPRRAAGLSCGDLFAPIN